MNTPTNNPDTLAADMLRERDDLLAQVGRLKAGISMLLRGRVSLNAILHNQVLAMQAAIIEYVKQPGHDGAGAVRWMINTLRGPGLLPNLEEVDKVGSAQAWFDAKTAEEEARVASLPEPDELPEPASAREVMAAAAHLATLARQSGWVLRIEQQPDPRKPLAQGNHCDRITVYKPTELRRLEEAEAERKAQEGQQA